MNGPQRTACPLAKGYNDDKYIKGILVMGICMGICTVPTVDFVELWTVFYGYCSLLGRSSSNMGSLISTDHRSGSDLVLSA